MQYHLLNVAVFRSHEPGRAYMDVGDVIHTAASGFTLHTANKGSEE